jgi:hypothetical protein
MQVKSLLLLPTLMVATVSANEEKMPSMDFLEYLGGYETEIDGEIVSPIELDLIAENTQGEDTDHE